jgi:hypothetical protein
LARKTSLIRAPDPAIAAATAVAIVVGHLRHLEAVLGSEVARRAARSVALKHSKLLYSLALLKPFELAKSLAVGAATKANEFSLLLYRPVV